MEKIDELLGFDIKNNQTPSIPNIINKKAKLRNQYRLKDDFQKSDELREEINKKGYEILDKGDTYKIKRTYTTL